MCLKKVGTVYSTGKKTREIQFHEILPDRVTMGQKSPYLKTREMK